MHKLLFLMTVCLLPFSMMAQTTTAHNQPPGKAAGYASRDATVLSMMGWGVGLAAGIAALCALIQNETATSHSHS